MLTSSRRAKRRLLWAELLKLLQPFDNDIDTKVRNIVTIIASIPACSDLGLVRQSDRFLYDQITVNLFFDTDGIGKAAQVQIAQLSNQDMLTNVNITVIA
ncbi:MAG: hypothetical protein V7K84_25045 [Nostoc sp.]